MSHQTQEDTDDIFPLSFAQQQLWFLDQMQPGNPAYNMRVAVRVAGKLQPLALAQSLNEIIRRHEALRTRFALIEGQPMQIISGVVQLALTITDLSELRGGEQAEQVNHLATRAARRSFDLAQAPLVRVTLLKLDDAEHVLLLTMHHIVSDARSLEVLFDELSTFYKACSSGMASLRDDLQIQYVDYAQWQREWLQGEALDRLLHYWQRQLDGAPAYLELPTRGPRPLLQRNRGKRLAIRLPLDLTRRLQAFSQSEGVTLFMTLLATFQILLARYSGQTDVVVGTPTAGRNRTEVEPVIGFFINSLALRVDMSGNPAFKELLDRAKAVCLEGFSHQELPFSLLLEMMQPERALSHQPIFQTMFQLQNAAIDGLKLAGLEVKPIIVESDTAKFDMTLMLAPSNEGLEGFWEYDTDLFERPFIARMWEHFQTLLEGMLANPQQRVLQLPLLTKQERQQMVVEWNQTGRDYPLVHSVHELFEQQVEQRPDAIAVICQQEALSYAELNQRANQLAHHLVQMGVGPEALVGLCVERNLEMLVGLLGILKAGGAYLPLDPSYPIERLAFMLEDAEVSLLLTQQHLRSRLPVTAAMTVICLDGDWQQVAEQADSNPCATASGDNLAYVIYTSGSTGQPKGVQVTHRALSNLLLSMAEQPGLSADDRLAALTTLSFDIAALELYLPLICGGRLLVVSRQAASDGEALKQLLEESEATVMQATPAGWRLLMESSWRGSRQMKGLVGGEALSQELAAELAGRVGELWNMYGPTETTIWSSAKRQRGEGQVRLGGGIGNTQMYVRSGEGEEVPMGVSGELYIGGMGLARGYRGRAAETAMKFVPSKYGEGEREYRTGDEVKWRGEGEMEYMGRRDEQVKVRGHRIELGEVESVVREQEGVREAVVVVKGEGEAKRLVGYVVKVVGASVSVGEMRERLKERLPEYMVPWKIVELEKLPLTANGKVDRKRMPEVEASRERRREYEGPRTASEEMLVGIWSEVLKIEQVSIHDSFFELGGHSLLATRLVVRLREVFGVDLPLRKVFDLSTPAQLSRLIETARKQHNPLPVPAIRPLNRDQHLPLSFAQYRLWFLNQLDPDSITYNMTSTKLLQGRLNLEALAASLNEIRRRHEALRTVFRIIGEEPAQVITAAQLDLIPLIDLSSLAEGKRQSQVESIARMQAYRVFDLSTGPLLRASLLKLSEAEHVLLVTLHHIISDGWSMGVLFSEMNSLYHHYSAGETSELAELAVQYADYAAWQREWLQGKVLEPQLAYWKQQLAATPAELELPADRPRPAVPTYRGAAASLTFDEEVSGALKALSRAEGVTLFMSLLAAFQVLLMRYSNQQDILVGAPIAGRNCAEVEGLIGFFVNTLVLRADLSGTQSFRDVLRRTRETALDAYANQDIPFEKIVEELQPQRSAGSTPFFRVMFILQNAPRDSSAIGDLMVTPLSLKTDTVNFDMSLVMTDTGHGLMCKIRYNADLFEASTIKRMLGHYQNLLNAIPVSPARNVIEMPLLSPVERHELLNLWNQTARRYPHNQGLHRLIEAQVEKSPDAVALAFEDEQVTYRQLNQRANQLAHYLQRLGIGPETRVGVCVERSIEMIVGLLAALKAGGVYVPLDPSYPRQRLAYMLEDSAIPVLLTQEHLVERLPQHQAQVICLDADWRAADAQVGENLSIDADGDNLAYVIYTSGSTGQPKGAMNTHRGICNRLLWMLEIYTPTSEDAVLQKTPSSFDVSVWECFWPLVTGARLVIARPDGHKDSAYLVEVIAKQQITVLHFVPSMLQAILLEEGLNGCASLRAVLCGGEAMSMELQEGFHRRLSATLYNMYGPAEAAVDVTYWKCNIDDLQRAVPIGYPIANTRIHILDSKLQPVPVGVTGELVIGGEGLARGYLNRPDLTADKFVANPFDDEDRLYRSGDLARYRADGAIEFLGRMDHQVKLRGFRIELGEIETVLKQHPAIRAAIVMACDDARGGKRLVGCVVPMMPQVLNIEELRSHLKNALPEYMMPAAFAILEAIPLSPNGKVDRLALAALIAQTPAAERVYVAPRTPIEADLCRMWCELLKVERVSVYDNFFELGGHSLLLTQLAARIRSAFRVDLPLRLLFEAPTVIAMAKTVLDRQVKQVDKQKLSEMLKQLKNLSAQEAKALLEPQV